MALPRSAVLLTALLLAACQDVPKPHYTLSTDIPSAEHQARYEACVAKHAELLDDGLSPANVVGRSIAASCNKEFLAYTMLIVADDNQAVQNAFYHRLTNDPEISALAPTRYVLSRRAKIKGID